MAKKKEKEMRLMGIETDVMYDPKIDKLNLELAVTASRCPLIYFENKDGTKVFFRMHLREAIELKSVIDNLVLDYNEFLVEEVQYGKEERNKE